MNLTVRPHILLVLKNRSPSGQFSSCKCFSSTCCSVFLHYLLSKPLFLGKHVSCLPDSPLFLQRTSSSLCFQSFGINWARTILGKHCFSVDHWVALSSMPQFPQGEGWLSILLVSDCLSWATALHLGVKIPSPLGITVSCCLSNFLTISPHFNPCLTQQPEWCFWKYISQITSFFA